MKTKIAIILIFLSLTVGPAAAQGQTLRQSISAGQKFLLAQISPAGNIYGGISDKTDSDYGLDTLLTISALLKSGVSPTNAPPLQRAINWAAKEDFTNVAAHAMRIIAFEKLRSKSARELIAADTKWLIKATCKNGGWSWLSADINSSPQTNNLATAWAIQALTTASRRGVAVDKKIWKATLNYWLAQQASDGGWAFTKFRGNTKRQANAYGSMTTRAILSIWQCYLGYRSNENLAPGNGITIEVNNAIERGWRWLDVHFELDTNPQKGMEWYYDYLAALESLASKMGYRQFHGRLFGKEISSIIMSRQNANGSWGLGNDLIEPTCAALGALKETLGTMFISKLQYEGNWNARPDDARNLVKWIDNTYELKLQWQVLGLRTRQKHFTQAGRLLYISGKGRFNFTQDDTAKLRDFINRGGMIVSEAVNNNGEFSLSIRRLLQKLSPNSRVQPLTANSPLLNMQIKLEPAAKGWVLTNGTRIIAVHLPWDASRTFQLNNYVTGKKTYQLFANIFLYIRGKGRTKIQLLPPPPQKLSEMTKRHIDIARLKFKGNYNPEPYALRYFSNYMIRKYSTRLFVDNFVSIEQLNARTMPIAYLGGAGEFPAQSSRKLLALQKYLIDGGTLIVEAIGGDKKFANSVKTNLLSKIGKLRPYKQINGKISKKSNQLQAINLGGRPAIIFSPIDLQESLIGATYWDLDGFNGQAKDVLGHIFTNILSDLKASSPKKP